MQILRRCNSAGCRELIKSSERYCDKHAGIVNKRYNKARYESNPEYVAFYNSKAWRSLRRQKLLDVGFLCEICESNGLYSEATVVHHVKEVSERWDLRLDFDNLQAVCTACHNRAHGGK